MTTALRLLSAGSIRRGVSGVVEMFERATGVRVEVDFTSAPKVQARVLASARADVVIASASVIDELMKESRLVSGSRGVVGRTAMAVAVAVRVDAAFPDISSTNAFREAMLDADLLAYNQGTSGIPARQAAGHARGVRRRVRFSLQRAGRVHHRPEPAVGRWTVPGTCLIPKGQSRNAAGRANRKTRRRRCRTI